MAIIDTPIGNELCGLSDANDRRVHAITGFGFTDRQARFLVLVMRHSGVCVPRQYATLAGIANGGRKCNALFERLGARGFARAIPCVHNRARVYHVHAPELYRAIGELASRYRRPVPVARVAERLMLLDAVLATPGVDWLTTPAEKRAWLQRLSTKTVAESSRNADIADHSPKHCEAASTLPIGLDSIGRVVLLYLMTEPWTAPFQRLLRRHARVLGRSRDWSLQLVVPRLLNQSAGAYVAVARGELDQPPDASIECVRLPHSYHHLSPVLPHEETTAKDRFGKPRKPAWRERDSCCDVST